jgi:multiple sugar transport system substrate-binding protein
MTKHASLIAGTFAFLASTALPALADTEISFLACGDKMQPAHADFIKKWEAANPGYKIVGASARTR